MIFSGIGYVVRFEMRSFYPAACSKEEFERQLETMVQGIISTDMIPIAVGVRDANMVTLVFHLSSEAQEVRTTLQAIELLQTRDGDPWWVKASRGEAPRDDSPAGDLPELPEKTL
jgi:hypothetical protein